MTIHDEPRATPESPAPSAKMLLRALAGECCERPPFWFMRQAGRYLPEYREVRRQAGSFLDLCYNPELAAEVTLQPIRRYGMDAAILFADILVVPDALGQPVTYAEGEGPMLEPVRSPKDLERLSTDRLLDNLAPVVETIRLVRGMLAENVALIGFAGAPWTVATYMVQGHGSINHAAAKAWAYGDPRGFGRLIELLVDATAAYLEAQASAGAEVLQIFDTWAGVLPDEAFRRWCVEPTAEIVRRVRKAHPTVPIIGFPRGAGVLYKTYVAETGVQGISLDYAVPMEWAAVELQPMVTVQGALDPQFLMVGGEEMEREARRILAALGRGPFVFNLGHGIQQGTPPEHVAALAAIIKAWRP